MLRRTVIHLAVLATLAACGPGSPNNPGTGTQTLQIDGNVSSSERQSNAQTPEQFSTDFDVRVTKAGAVVSDATVVVRSSCGEVTLTFDMGSGRYTGNQSSYCTTYTLDVTSGADRVAGVTVAGPAIHRITAPMDRQNLDPRQSVLVTWTPGGSGSARVETRDYSTTVDDRGSAGIPAGRLRSDVGTATNERVRVTRSSRVVPAGATGDSSFSVSLRNAVEVFTVTN
ncbi:MAG: hypothetical protein JNK05_14070 [Myxococcales bacterium]|nr:hypothetical protein [Myxococcales bacterium]